MKDEERLDWERAQRDITDPRRMHRDPLHSRKTVELLRKRLELEKRLIEEANSKNGL